MDTQSTQSTQNTSKLDAQKLKWIVPGAVLVVLALAWGVVQYLGNKAEERLLDTLAEYGLEHRVTWQGLSASFGSVTLKDVRFDLNSKAGWQAGRVKISDLINDDDRQRLHVQVEGLSAFDAQGTSAVLAQFIGWPSGKADLAPLDADIKLDVRYDKGEARAAVALKQKGGLDADASVELTQPGQLRALARAAAGTGSSRRSPFGSARDLPDWNGIQLKTLEIKLQDRGVIKRGVALFKRHNTVLEADGGSAKSQQNKGFERAIKALETDCLGDGMAVRSKNAKDTCRAVTRFLSGDKDTLRISMEPRRPVPLVAALANYLPPLRFFSDGPEVPMQALNLEVKS